MAPAWARATRDDWMRRLKAQHETVPASGGYQSIFLEKAEKVSLLTVDFGSTKIETDIFVDFIHKGYARITPWT